jgi:hypothetical protein
MIVTLKMADGQAQPRLAWRQRLGTGLLEALLRVRAAG